MKQLLTFSIILLAFITSHAQEVCNNGIDDDFDGLIDCYDPDCCADVACQDHYYTACNGLYGCTVDSFNGNFSIQQLWQNTESINNIAIPVVGDLDNDGIPEAVATKRLAASNALLIFDTQTGTVKQTINASTGGDNTYNAGIALGDINNDGIPEIIYPSGNHYLYCYSTTGTLLWTSSQPVTTTWATVASIADLNHDGLPEVYAGAYVLNGQDGTVMGTLPGSYGHTGGQPGIGDFANPVAVDVLPSAFCIACQGLELVAGNTVYSIGINTGTNTATIVPQVTIGSEPDGLTSVADWDHDGDLDGIITHTIGNQARLYVWDLQTPTLIGTTGNVSRGGSSGTIGVSTTTVADIDNDGMVEASFVLNQRLLMIENDFSIKWSVTNSDISGSTGTTLYDFDGDGDYELVYRDETLLRIFDAITGTVQASIPCTSGTGTERPIVADINADGQTEILCTCNGGVDGNLTAFGSDASPWMPARKLWNQYQYFAVNINDDLSVPRQQQAHHIVGNSVELNSFLKQYQNETETPVPDATIQILSFNNLTVDSATIQVQICNQGDYELTANTPIAFYMGDPTATAANQAALGQLLGTNVQAGDCLSLNVRVSIAGNMVFAVVNDDTSTTPIFSLTNDFPVTSIPECNYTNNMASIAFASEICDNGIDDDGDGLIDCLDPDCVCDICSNKQGNIWYFGVNGGLDFSSGSPVVINDGQLNTREGCATIADPNGNILFYTNGVSVWDRNHAIMPNGTGLLGDPSSSQSAIIVPQPDSPALYYIFTVSDLSSSNGFRYSIVDLRLNGGTGDVVTTQKNVLLFNNTTEKVTAVRHCNGKDFWVIGHPSNTNLFNVYNLTSTGLNVTPVTSTVGTVIGGGFDMPGYLRASATGDRLAMTFYNQETIELYDFDNSTGGVSNPITLSNPSWGRPYGLEFSPNGNILYASKLNAPAQILQFDLTSGVQATILASATVIANSASQYQYAALQNGPDGKLYVARPNGSSAANPFLAEIQFPNVLGLGATFVDMSIDLSPGQSYFGLPNFVPSYFGETPFNIVGLDTLCTTTGLTTYNIDASFSICSIDTVIWTYGGNNTVSSITDSTIVLDISTVGVDTIIAEVRTTCTSTFDTLLVPIVVCPEVCGNGIDDDGDGLVDCYDPDCCADCVDYYYNTCPNVTCTSTFTSPSFTMRQKWQSAANVTNWGTSAIGDIDNDGNIEVVGFRSDGAGYAFDGQTGVLKYTYNAGSPTTSSGYPSIADADNDGFGEVVIRQGNNLCLYEHDGTIKWSVAITYDVGDNTYGFYDFNQDGIPEIVYGRKIYSSIDGLLLATAVGSRGKNLDYSVGGLTVAADVVNAADCANDPACNGIELIAGPDVYSVDIQSYTNSGLNTIAIVKTMAGYGDGFTSVADFDRDGNLDIIVAGYNTSTNQRGVYVWNPKTEALIRPFWVYSTSAFALGRPNIADFDGDQMLEIAVCAARSGGGRLHVLDNDMTILWFINNNDNSGATGCTAFDFDNDGQKEVVYRDQSNLQILNGSTGATLATFGCTSGTVVDYPQIADVDNDGQAEISCHCGGTPSNVNIARINVFESDANPWAPSRTVWNQHTYFNTNVEDDLTIPTHQQLHHIVADSLLLNNFLNQYSNPEFPQADATTQVLLGVADGPDSSNVTVEVCNIGDNILPSSTPITFYSEDPTANATSSIAAIQTIGQPIEIGACDTFVYKVDGTSGSVYAVINCDNSVPPIFDLSTDFPITTIGECDYTNNMSAEVILLNVDLESYKVKKYEEKQVQILWRLANPQQYTTVIIERSANGIDFEPISAKLQPTLEQFLDSQPLQGDNYYRLKLIKTDQTYGYTEIKQLYFGTEQVELLVHPNPFDNRFNIELRGEGIQKIERITILNTLGQELLSKKVAKTTNYQLNLAQLSSGTYWIKVQAGDILLHRKIIKQ